VIQIKGPTIVGLPQSRAAEMAGSSRPRFLRVGFPTIFEYPSSPHVATRKGTPVVLTTTRRIQIPTDASAWSERGGSLLSSVGKIRSRDSCKQMTAAGKGPHARAAIQGKRVRGSNNGWRQRSSTYLSHVHCHCGFAFRSSPSIIPYTPVAGRR
jgi:hypothetical protein